MICNVLAPNPACLEQTCKIVGRLITDGKPSCTFYERDKFNSILYGITLREYAKPKLHTFISTCESNQAKSTADIYIRMTKDGETAFYAETKYDGERMQIHVSKGCITIYSKSGRNSTQDRAQSHDIIRTCLGITNPLQVAENVKRGSFLFDVDECILEGELLVYSDKHGIERFGGVSDFRQLFGKAS
jgi:ATP-dependent DNA ligase